MKICPMYKQVDFSLRRNVIFPTCLTQTGSEFHRVGEATEKTLLGSLKHIGAVNMLEWRHS